MNFSLHLLFLQDKKKRANGLTTDKVGNYMQITVFFFCHLNSMNTRVKVR